MRHVHDNAKPQKVAVTSLEAQDCLHGRRTILPSSKLEWSVAAVSRAERAPGQRCQTSVCATESQRASCR